MFKKNLNVTKKQPRFIFLHASFCSNAQNLMIEVIRMLNQKTLHIQHWRADNWGYPTDYTSSAIQQWLVDKTASTKHFSSIVFLEATWPKHWQSSSYLAIPNRIALKPSQNTTLLTVWLENQQLPNTPFIVWRSYHWSLSSPLRRKDGRWIKISHPSLRFWQTGYNLSSLL